MCILSNFGERLKELMEERGINSPALAEELKTDRSNITRYLRGERAPLYDNFIKILNYFNCSADFILGLTDYTSENAVYKQPQSFDERLRYVIEICGFTQYKMQKSGKFSGAELYGWLSGKKLPSVESLVKLSTYLGCSIDFLLGRV